MPSSGRSRVWRTWVAITEQTQFQCSITWTRIPKPKVHRVANWTSRHQGHRIKIGGLGRMANSAFGGKLNLCGTCSHLFTMFVVYLVVGNKYNVYVRQLVTIENP